MDPGDIHRLRTALRDLVALSTIPAAWVGREPSAVAAGLADVLVGSLHLDFAFVRLCDPNGGAAVDVTRGDAWKAFPHWLHGDLGAEGSEGPVQTVRKCLIRIGESEGWGSKDTVLTAADTRDTETGDADCHVYAARYTVQS